MPEVGRFGGIEPALEALGSPELEQITGRNILEFLSEPQNLNAYSYALNNPIKYVDPTGNTWQEWAWGFTVGAFEAFWGGIKNTWQIIRHPIDSLKSVIAAAPHIFKVLSVLKQEYYKRFKDLYAGSDYESGKAAGEFITELLLVYIATKGIDKLKNIAELKKLLEVAERIGRGHAWEKHKNQFPEFSSQEELIKHINDIMLNPSDKKTLKDGRIGYWHEESKTVVIFDPNHPDFGTAFKPENEYKYFTDDLE